ncbi:nuclease s1 [Grosmannia clavigera kw1407]|uniref:Nuclease s1 n=1 Tax=Grosmannia clavigera (strain kw1407 / UAMH 11150) TaxID=655863 RepID=F0XDD6_GROCL|nr:nuclease s1 [Grosmannia clavigera kw1407]EFX03737.1 nuclease s1 [Grosmannia clavigera kw1407]
MHSSAVLLGLGATLQGAHAWGSLGHATVAYVAQDFVTADTKAWAQGVLSDTSTSYLASIASWADSYRATAAGKWSAPFHFIDAEDSPPSSCGVNYDRDCGSTGCSISAIANYTRRVSSSSLSAANVDQALKFLVHLVGDITQPLHDESLERGGNEITTTFDGYSSDNLHADWDTYIPEKLTGGSSLAVARTWATNLTTAIKTGSYKSAKASWIDGDDITDAITTATRWASDANAYVCTVVMPDGVAALQSGDLYPTYYDSVVPTVELQIAKGGYRLANWLNKIYEADIATKRRRSAEPVAMAQPQPDLSGADLLPPPRALSKAKLARAAMSGECCTHAH